jgi:hypothetical protein
MGKMIGKLFGMKEPKADPNIARVQAQERADQTRRQTELDGEHASLTKVLTSGRLGRQMLAFKPGAQSPDKLG